MEYQKIPNIAFSPSSHLRDAWAQLTIPRVNLWQVFIIIFATTAATSSLVTSSVATHQRCVPHRILSALSSNSVDTFANFEAYQSSCFLNSPAAGLLICRNLCVLPPYIAKHSINVLSR